MSYFLFFILVCFVQSSVEYENRFSAYANQFYNHADVVSLTDVFGKEYLFDTFLQMENWQIYRHYEITALNPRKYIVVHDNPEHVGTRSTVYPSINSTYAHIYPTSTILEIIALKYIPSEARIRGQIKDTLDWISIENPESGYLWAKPVQPMIEICKFHPGTVGIKHWEKEVVFVLPNSQASGQNIQSGWEMVKINDEQYSENLLLEKIGGNETYEITFVKNRNFIEFEVMTYDENTSIRKTENKLTIQFTKLDAIFFEDTKSFLDMFVQIYENSPFETELKIKDQYNFPKNLKNNLFKANLKFMHFLKHGKTFLEQFNFHYIIKIPKESREVKDMKLPSKFLKPKQQKYSYLPSYETVTVSEVVKSIEAHYSTSQSKVDSRIDFFHIFNDQFSDFFEHFPVDMIYRSPYTQKEQNFKRQKNSGQSTSVLRFFRKSKTTEGPDNFL